MFTASCYNMLGRIERKLDHLSMNYLDANSANEISQTDSYELPKFPLDNIEETECI